MPQERLIPLYGWRRKLFVIIFEADTPQGRAFDLAILALILMSVTSVTLESVESINAEYGHFLYALDWVFTILFTIEYVLRLCCVHKPVKYATSFFGIVDFLSILPLYLGLFMPAGRFLTDIRVLRLLRLFRVLKLTHYMGEAQHLRQALLASRRKITVFLGVVLMLVVILGTLMYLIEGPEYGFTSIPKSIYWAIVTLTTVGFGDITPHTPIGQAIASLAMILGYGIIAVPTGIVSAEFSRRPRKTIRSGTRLCPHCFTEGHDWDAKYCKICGGELPRPANGKIT